MALSDARRVSVLAERACASHSATLMDSTRRCRRRAHQPRSPCSVARRHDSASARAHPALRPRLAARAPPVLVRPQQPAALRPHRPEGRSCALGRAVATRESRQCGREATRSVVARALVLDRTRAHLRSDGASASGSRGSSSPGSSSITSSRIYLCRPRPSPEACRFWGLSSGSSSRSPLASSPPFSTSARPGRAPFDQTGAWRIAVTAQFSTASRWAWSPASLRAACSRSLVPRRQTCTSSSPLTATSIHRAEGECTGGRAFGLRRASGHGTRARRAQAQRPQPGAQRPR